MEINIGNNIRKFRNEMGYSTYELSDKTGIPQSTISKLENNKRRFDVETLTIIAKALDIPLISLLEDEKNYRYLSEFYPIGQIIKEFRKENNLSIEDFALKANVRVQFIERIEKGLSPYVSKDNVIEEPTICILLKIAKLLTCSIEDLTLETGFYSNYNELMEHHSAINLSIPLVEFLSKNDNLLKPRISPFLEEYGYNYIEDNFTFEEAKRFYLNEIINYDLSSINSELDELNLIFDSKKQEFKSTSSNPNDKNITTIAAHLPDGVELTKEEEKQLDDYIKFILSKRKE